MLVEHVNAILLTGGSAFGLAAADGVVRYLEERGLGFDAGVATVPIVPAAVLFDLGVGEAHSRPGPDDGYHACENASGHVDEGRVGAGTGATVAKLHGPERARPGGVGTASVERGDLVVGALVAVNAMGEVLDENGGVLVGAVPEEDPEAEPHQPQLGMNTTIGVVATNARLSKERAHLLALAAHAGLDAAIRPAHTIWDGDTVFSLATCETDASQPELEELAERVVAEAIRRAVSTSGGRIEGDRRDEDAR
jgi:L-aminopeptidase/D-esterase-like protein